MLLPAATLAVFSEQRDSENLERTPCEKEQLLLGESPDSLVYVVVLFSPRLFPAAIQRVGRMKSS